MAKELPYFKFEPNQWENGNIQMLSREDKGLFIDLCSMYWSRLGDVPFKLAMRKLCDGNATALKSLCAEEIIEIKDDAIHIAFLREQLLEFEHTSTQNSRNAKLRWEKANKDKASSERNATASNPQCESDAIREEKRREEERKKEILSLSLENDFTIFWDKYNKKVDSKKCKGVFLKLKDSERIKILEVVDSYVYSTPDIQFRKNPLTWLNGKCWEDIEVNIHIPTVNRPFGKTNQI